MEPNVAYARFASCNCVYCKTGDVYQMKKCLNQSTVGILTKYILKKDKPAYCRPPPKKKQKTSNK